MKPKETVQALLNDIRNPKTVRDLCVQDVTYVSLNYSNPDLHKINWFRNHEWRERQLAEKMPAHWSRRYDEPGHYREC